MLKNKKWVTMLAVVLCICSLLPATVQAAAKLPTPKITFKNAILPLSMEGFQGNLEDYSPEEIEDLFAKTFLTLAWNEVPGATGYEVYYRMNVPGTEYELTNEKAWEKWEVTKTTKKSAENWIIDGVFQMKVRAYKGSSYSDFSETVTVAGGEGIIKTPTTKPVLSAKTKTLYTGNSYTLSLKNTTKKVTWKSSNTKVATVNSKGVVKAKAKGTCTITATSNGKKYTCKITVKKITAIDLYKKKLEKRDIYELYGKTKRYPDWDSAYFTLLDIDQNGTKELLVYGWPGASSMDQTLWIYTFSGGKLKKAILPAHSTTMEYYKDSKCIKNVIWYMGSIGGGDSTEYYTIKNGKVVVSAKGTCKGKAKDINCGYFGEKYGWHKITDANIKKYCK